jgi:hypothetical protein
MVEVAPTTPPSSEIVWWAGWTGARETGVVGKTKLLRLLSWAARRSVELWAWGAAVCDRALSREAEGGAAVALTLLRV